MNVVSRLTFVKTNEYLIVVSKVSEYLITVFEAVTTGAIIMLIVYVANVFRPTFARTQCT